MNCKYNNRSDILCVPFLTMVEGYIECSLNGNSDLHNSQKAKEAIGKEKKKEIWKKINYPNLGLNSF